MRIRRYAVLLVMRMLPLTYLFSNSCKPTTLPHPLVEYVDPPAAFNGQPQCITILGQNFLLKLNPAHQQHRTAVDRTYVAELIPEGHSERSEEMVILRNVSYLDVETLQAEIPSGIPHGIYDLRVVDPYGRPTRLLGAYQATEQIPPQIITVTPHKVINSQPSHLLIRGHHFTPSSVVRLGDHVLEPIVASAFMIEVRLEAGFEEGTYRLTVENQIGQKSYLDNIVSVYAPWAQ